MTEYRNTLYYGDNLEAIELFYQKFGNIIDLIYIDPPFNSNKNYKTSSGEFAFADMWDDEHSSIELIYLMGEDNNKKQLDKRYSQITSYIRFLQSSSLPKSYTSYLSFIAIRVISLYKILKDTGSFYFHCDPLMSHYIKIILDFIFGVNSFKNEIVWQYFSGGKSHRFFPKKHDIIFFYVKNPQNYTFNSLKMKRYLDYKPSLKNYSKEGELGKDDIGYWSLIKVPDVWQVKGVFNMSNQYSGYPTQKPLQLLDRIILSSSNEGDIIGDFFAGCGTTLISATMNNRKFAGCDFGEASMQQIVKRFEKNNIKKDVDYDFISIKKND